MTMTNRGLNKLMEECGEVIQVAAKLSAYPDGNHPDGAGNLMDRLEDEIADAAAAMAFVVGKLGLNYIRMDERTNRKLTMFLEWDQDPDA